jgi:RNA-binding protein YhbY
MFRGDEDDVQEIATILAREQGKRPVDVWEEALMLYRVRFETEVLPDPTDEDDGTDT